MTGTDPRLVHIGEVVDRTGLSHRTIRYYEEMGLLTPAGRTEGGFRLYDEAGIERLLLVKPMKPLGFTIEQIGELLRALDTVADPDADDARRATAAAVVERTHTSAQERVVELKAATARAEAFTERLTHEMETGPARPR